MKKLLEFTEENSDEILTTDDVSEDKINELEKELGIKFCDDMVRFLKSFGMLLGFGVEIIGVGKNGSSPLVKNTKHYREHGLENNYIVISDAGEFVYCLNNDNGKVSTWDMGNRKHIEEPVSDLEEFILNELTEAKEDWDEDDDEDDF